MRAKFPELHHDPRVLQRVYDFYDTLPMAIFVGVQSSEASESRRFVLACHGGLEVGWDPSDFLQVRVPTAPLPHATLTKLPLLPQLCSDHITLDALTIRGAAAPAARGLAGGAG